MDRQLAKKTDKVLFVEIQNDGFDLGAQRRPIDKNNLPKALEVINQWQNSINAQTEFSTDSKIITLVEKSKLAENGEYNLTASRYKETHDFSICKWDMVKLGDICENITKGTTPTTNGFEFTNEGINFVKIESIDLNGNFIPSKFAHVDINCHNAFKRSQLLENDILFSIAGALGRVAIVNKNILPANTNQALAIIRLKKDVNASNKYIANILKSQYILDKITSLKTGVAQYNLSLSQISNLEIPLPPLEVQEEIVKELDGYQAVIDGAQKVIDNWKPTIPINPEWEKVKLGDVVDIYNGSTPLKTNDEYWNKEDIPWFTIEDIRKQGRIISSTQKYITSKALNETSVKLLPKNTVLICCTASIGEHAITKIELTTNQQFNGMVIKEVYKNRLLPEYLFWITSTFKNELLRLSGKTSFEFVSVKTLKTIGIPLPSLDVQQKIVSAIEDEKKAIEECKKLIKLHQEKTNIKIQSIWSNSCE
jgi:type I restriction enzyme M protein